ncbi:hypothetical protein SEPCBS119000_002635 [Sporothrix epigloea]|uniref:Major facilitator superfamily (MFS) profile domain-containing protein n=1 Tax=Sporothrix epigloea TaxID=1892477 RepID=A0ABP0DLC7_9PEZI
MGIGIGAEYPLSAVITSEWSSTSSRATMLSSVFLMQPLGQALAQLVGVWVVLGREKMYHIQELQCGINTAHDDECRKIVDGIWRIVIGSGAVPALLAIIFRFFLYDCGLYTLEVKNKPFHALRDTQRIYGAPLGMLGGGRVGGDGGTSINSGAMSLYSPGGAHADEPAPVQFSVQDLKNYFIRDENWYYLLGTASAWFFLDVSFYGFSLDNRGVLADLWVTRRPPSLNSTLSCWNSTIPGGNSTLPAWSARGHLPIWQTDPTKPCNNIYQVLIQQAKQYLLTVSLASIAGSACFIFAANRIRRRQWLTASFVCLFFLFIVTGAVYYGVGHTKYAPATVTMVAVCHFVFNFGEFEFPFTPSYHFPASAVLTDTQGANSLTFIIPAEIFPTCYRCTCHGISAAAGKLGSIIAVLIVYGVDVGYVSTTRQGLLFLLFGTFMVGGAVYSWAYLPDVQRVIEIGRRTDGASGEILQLGPIRSGGMAGGNDARRNGRSVHSYDRQYGESRRKTVLETKNLEDLGEGRAKARHEGEVITLRDMWSNLKRRRGQSRLETPPAAA